MLDLSAAFDTPDHTILLNRFEHLLGITGGAIKWLRSYFAGRTQSVAIGSVYSPEFFILRCPQGSVLGPKAYLLYTQPLGDIFRKHGLAYMLYADDSQCYTVIKTNDRLNRSVINIQNCIAEVRDWMNANLLKLNCDKTEFIVFNPKHSKISAQNITINLDGDILSPTNLVKNLGVIQDSGMTMEKQVNSIARSCYHHIRNIGRIRRNIDTNACRSLVHAHITSRLDYANSLLHGLPGNLLGKLQRIQNAAARLICLRKKCEHITPVLVDLHWLPIEYRVRYKILVLTFKAIKDESPRYISDLVSMYRPTRSL